MASINFLYRSTKDESNLVLRFLYRNQNLKSTIKDKKTGQEIEVPYTDFVFGAKTQFKTSKKYWSKLHKKTKFKKTNDIDILNEIQELKDKQNTVTLELNKIESHILNAFNTFRPDAINKKWLQTQIDNYYNPAKQPTTAPLNLIDYIDYYIDYRKNEITKSTLKKINVIKQLLTRFQTHRKSIILIKDINDTFKNEFVIYCKSEKYAQNTIQRAFVFIKTFCKHARFKGIETHHELDGLKIDRAKVEKIYLTPDDLIKIENISNDKLTDSLNNAKDWLIISCYTGQRVSDFMKFTDEQIRIEDNKHLIEFTQKKTDKNMTVPLHSKVLEILKKRNGKFPKAISDQKYNDYIKKVCELAEINELTKGSIIVETEPDSGIYRKKSGTYKKWQLVTSHIGRRSFATNFYGKIPTTYLIYVTGHSTEKMFLNYIGKSNKDLAMEMTKYF